MSLTACGLNHKTAPLKIRERFCFTPDEMAEPLRSLVSNGCAEEAAILSTCNRTEIYCDAKSHNDVIDILSAKRNIDASTIRKHFYFHQDQNAIKHMLRVATGLDSMLLGEPQVLGQMKQAFQMAHHAGTLGPRLGRVSQYIFSVSKRVRSETDLGAHSVSVAYVSVQLAKRLFEKLGDASVLLIGAGDTIELVAKYLQEAHVTNFTIANRSVARAKTLADKLEGKAISLNQISGHLPQSDIVICATNSPLPIIGKGALERAIRIRKHKPIFMIDLAVPRDIEAEVAALEDVYLYSLDDLQHIINDNLKQQKSAAQFAEEIVNLHTSHYLSWERSLSAVPLIRDYRNQCESTRDELLVKYLRELKTSENPDQVLQDFARVLTNKLMHQPCTSLKQAGFDGNYDLLESARDLLALDDYS